MVWLQALFLREPLASEGETVCSQRRLWVWRPRVVSSWSFHSKCTAVWEERGHQDGRRRHPRVCKHEPPSGGDGRAGKGPVGPLCSLQK